MEQIEDSVTVIKSIDVTTKKSKITVSFDDTTVVLRGSSFLLPDEESKLLWYAWPKSNELVSLPVFDQAAEYHDIKLLGKLVTQPRKTINELASVQLRLCPTAPVTNTVVSLTKQKSTHLKMYND